MKGWGVFNLSDANSHPSRCPRLDRISCTSRGKINTSKQSCISILNLFGANKELTGKQCEARSQWWVARPWAVSVDEPRLGGEGVAFQPACLPP